MINEITRAIDRKVGTASLMRIIYDSLAKCYAEAIDELEQNTNTKFGTINIIGGGSQDEFLNELTAKATGKKVITGPVEGTAIGNLAMQMIGCGEVENLQVARKIIKNSFDIREVKYE
jgi:rhamnulokinase